MKGGGGNCPIISDHGQKRNSLGSFEASNLSIPSGM